MSTWEEEQAQLRRFAAGEYKQIQTGGWQNWFGGPDLELVPPLAEVFSVCGDDGTNERARQWALWHRYLLVRGPTACAHGLLMMRCPRITADCCPEFDHTEVWVPFDEPHRPFILTHPYRSKVPEGIRAYARAHALEVSVTREADRWYQPNALPVRLTVTHTEVYPWPLGTRAIVLQHAFPVKWPDVSMDDVPSLGVQS